jgi:hypothetical protein
MLRAIPKGLTGLTGLNRETWWVFIAKPFHMPASRATLSAKSGFGGFLPGRWVKKDPGVVPEGHGCHFHFEDESLFCSLLKHAKTI